MRPERPHRWWWTESLVYWNVVFPRIPFTNNLYGSPGCISFFTWPYNNPGISSKGVALQALWAAEKHLNYDPSDSTNCSYITVNTVFSGIHGATVARSLRAWLTDWLSDWLIDSVCLKLKNYKWYQVETFTHYKWNIWQCIDSFHCYTCTISKKRWALIGS